jgi:spore coat polysaccharide biosynthesis protein SpsF
MKTAVILQARLGSHRLPEKVMKQILGRPMIELQIERLLSCSEVDEIILATTKNPEDYILCEVAKRMSIKFFQGSEKNVLQRFYNAASYFNVDNIIRCNADCPLIDPLVVDKVIKVFKKNKSKYDYVSNILEPSYPVGMHTEVFTFDALSIANAASKDDVELEHVTPYIYRRPKAFRLHNVKNDVNLSRYRLTVDFEIDFDLVKQVYEALYLKNKLFGIPEIVNFLDEHPEVFGLNSFIQKNSTV